MAHIGRFYKLQFRRDLASTPNNVDAYPEAFGVVIENVTGPVGTAIDRNRYQLVNLLTNAQPPMIWKNDSIVVASIRTEWTAKIMSPFVAAEASWEIKIVDFVSRAVLFRLIPPVGVAGLRFSNWSWPPFAPTDQSSQCHALGTNVSCSAAAEPWNRYNP